MSTTRSEPQTVKFRAPGVDTDITLVADEWNRASQSGSYARLTDDQFYVKATGGDVTFEELKQAVDAFSPTQLAQLERSP